MTEAFAAVLAWHKNCLHILCFHFGVQEGDPAGWWEEDFRGHKDSKPRGPNALAFDVLMPGTQNVYGIPERASKFSLPASAGEGETDVTLI